MSRVVRFVRERIPLTLVVYLIYFVLLEWLQIF